MSETTKAMALLKLAATDAVLNRSEYRAERPGTRDYVDVTLWHANNPERRLGSMGGSVMPAAFPEFFRHVGPDAGLITGRSGPAFRNEVDLPTIDSPVVIAYEED